MTRKGYNYPIKIKIALASKIFSWFGTIIISLFSANYKSILKLSYMQKFNYCHNFNNTHNFNENKKSPSTEGANASER